jgi:hypothetical protein
VIVTKTKTYMVRACLEQRKKHKKNWRFRISIEKKSGVLFGTKEYEFDIPLKLFGMGYFIGILGEN